MLTFYYHPASAFARPVWLALLEKGLDFEAISVDLGGEQFEAAFQAVNPFGQVPVLVSGQQRIIESVAILDYLEAQYPSPPLLPTAPQSLATVRMVQQITINKLIPVFFQLLANEPDSDDYRYGLLRGKQVLDFLSSLLIKDQPYYGGEQLTVAEIVAEPIVHRLESAGLSLANYPLLVAWSARLQARASWQAIALTPEEWQRVNRTMRVLPRVWKRRRQKRLKEAGG